MIRAQMMTGNPAYDDGDVEITDDADPDVFLLVRSDEVEVLAGQLTRFVRARDKRPTVPSRKSATLPKGLDKVQRHKDAEKNIV